MKKFEKPTLDVEKIDIADVIAVSGTEDNSCPNNVCPFDDE